MEKELGWYKESIDRFFCRDCFQAEKIEKEGYQPIVREDAEKDIFTCDKCGKVFPEGEQGFAGSEGVSPQAMGGDIEAAKRIKPEIRSWLILLAIVLVAIPLMYLYSLIDFISIFTDGTWKLITDTDSIYYAPGRGGHIIFEIIGQIVALFASFYLLFIFFKKSKRFPKFFIIYMVFCLIYNIIDFVAGWVILDGAVDSTYLRNSIISSCIWIPCMIKSKLVKGTFIN
jgi:hypothetical protein